MSPAELRLRDVPWSELPALTPHLLPALDALLDGAPAADVLERLLRAHRAFTAPQRRVCAEALFGVGLWRRRLRAHLGPAASSAELLTCLSDLPPPPPDWRDATSIPDWLADVLTAAVGDEAPALADAFNLPGPVTVRVNRLRATREQLRAALAEEGRTCEPGRWSDDALHLTTRPANPTATQAWRDGWFELQDEGSQLLAALVPAAPSDSLLDLCAGAGGKTLALASRLPRATLHATDLDASRLDRLRTRASRAGAAVRLHGATPPDELLVHHVLVDAPCSELGALRRGPDVRWRIDPSTFASLAPVQRALLDTAARHLLPGGTITWATCTLRPEENELLVHAFLAENPRFHLERASAPAELLHPDGTLRTFPHRHGTDGFFAAVLRWT